MIIGTEVMVVVITYYGCSHNILKAHRRSEGRVVDFLKKTKEMKTEKKETKWREDRATVTLL